MLSDETKAQIRTHYEYLKSFRGVAKLMKVSPNTVRNVVFNLHVEEKKKGGPKEKINARQKTIIKRTVASLRDNERRVTSKKIHRLCNLNHVTERTVRNTLRSMKMTFKTATRDIVLTSEHKRKRLELAE